MDKAFQEVALPPDAEAYIRHFFEGMATFMINRAPEGAQQ
jgi:hypothetical protein